MRGIPHGPSTGTSLLICGASILVGLLLGHHPEWLGPLPASAAAASTPMGSSPSLDGPTPLPLFGRVAPTRRETPSPKQASAPDGASLEPATDPEHPQAHVPSLEHVPNAERALDPAPEHDGLGRAFGEGMLVTGTTPHRLILFTFDDGPDLRHTPELLDMLDELGIRAVFFLTAERIEPRFTWGHEHAELAREIVRRGHLVGNHTVDHAQLPLLTDVEIEAQLDESERIFGQVLGGRPWLFRPPGGARSARVDGLLTKRGYTTLLWNLGAGDFQVRTAEAVFETWRKVFERRRVESGDRGGIILLHDTHEWSVGAVPLIVDYLRRENCRLLREGQELYDIVDDPRFFVLPQGAAPPGAEAPPAMPPPDVLARRQARLRQNAIERCDGA